MENSARTIRRLTLQTLTVILLHAGVVIAGPLEECPEFTVYGVPGEAGDLLCRKGYLLSHDPTRKTPIWVAEHLTREKAQKKVAGRSDDFRPDSELEPGRRAELSDYRGSGYDRGHMAPAADLAWDEQAMSESFYLSNMVPQVGVGMNRGIWAELEKKVRNWALQRGELYVYSGPIYGKGEVKTIGRNKVAVPAMLYKIVLDPRQHEAIALIMPNRSLSVEDLPRYLVSVREVEQETGLHFFSTMPPADQEKLESQAASRLWQ
jgi:endonuclease G, mitochondrial